MASLGGGQKGRSSRFSEVVTNVHSAPESQQKVLEVPSHGHKPRSSSRERRGGREETDDEEEEDIASEEDEEEL